MIAACEGFGKRARGQKKGVPKDAFLHGAYEPDWARTSDPLIKSQLLYQLSYRPVSELSYTSRSCDVKKGRLPVGRRVFTLPPP